MRGELGDGRARPSTADAVPLARSIDIARRRRVYTIQMAIRLACVLLLPVVPGWWKALALAGAVVLPYVAVLLANDPDLRAERTEPAAPPPASRVPSQGDESPRVLRIDEDGTVIDVDEPMRGSEQSRSGTAPANAGTARRTSRTEEPG